MKVTSSQTSQASRVYGRLLTLLRGRDPQQDHEMREDAAQLLLAARARGRGDFATTTLALNGSIPAERKNSGAKCGPDRDVTRT